MLKILIVDDSLSLRTQLRNLLTGMGHEIIGEAGNGFEGVQKFIQLKPELVTLDLVMPQLDGFGALIKMIEYDPKAKVIMVSSAATSANHIYAKRSGAIGFLSKPVDKEMLALSLLEVEKLIAAERAA